MAAGGLVDRESLWCSICLDFFRDPVMIPCRHSFCRDCISGLWDREDVRNKFRCPQCKQIFPRRPGFVDCKRVKHLSENLKIAENEDVGHAVSCDSCSSRSSKAIVSCLTCLASFCSTHLDQHAQLHGRRRHQLTKATDLRGRICSHHGKLTDVYCRTDRQCVCVLCALQEHKSHETLPASDERAHRQRKMMDTRVKFLQNIKDREKDFKDLKWAEERIRCSAQTAFTETDQIFSDVLQSLQKSCCGVKGLITDQQTAEVRRVEKLQEIVQQKITSMKTKVSEIDQFVTTKDHIQFLQNVPLECEEFLSEESEDLSKILDNPNVFFHNLTVLLSKMQKSLMELARETETKIKSGEETDKQWDCDVCLVSNEELSGQCVACHSPKPSNNSHTSQKKKDRKAANQTLPAAQNPSSVLSDSARRDISPFGTSVKELSFSFQRLFSQCSSMKNSGTEANKPLLGLVELSIGEENERVVFRHRVQLFRYCREMEQWVGRGVGELKILQNNDSRCMRLVMRREKVLTLCANHWISAQMQLLPMERAWMWTAFDYSDGDGSFQMLAARFKLQETADEFKKAFEEAVAVALTETHTQYAQSKCA